MSVLKVPVVPDDHIQGNDHALVTLVEYGDYECPYCGMAYPIVKRLQKHFGPQLRFVFRHFPLVEVHPHAEMAAEAAEFAGEQRHFWEMHDLLYENQAYLNRPFLLELGEKLELSADLEDAIENRIYESKIRKDFLGGIRSGVNGTPTFFINDHRHNGAFEFEELAAAIESTLATH